MSDAFSECTFVDGDQPLKTMHQIYEEELRWRLKYFKGNKVKTAKSLGVTIKTLYNKMHEFSMEDQINWERFRGKRPKRKLFTDEELKG